MIYKKYTKFEVCTVKYLIDVLGWVELQSDPNNFDHVDFPGMTISRHMLEESQGETLTIRSKVSERLKNWYTVVENVWFWPVATFLSYKSPCKEICMHIKGMTPIFGWFICKLCGTNLEEIK